VVINNADVANFATIEDYSLEEWDAIILINLTGVFYGTKAVIEPLKTMWHSTGWAKQSSCPT